MAATERPRSLGASLKLAPKTTYLELLREKQERKHRALAGGEPPLGDVREPFSLLPAHRAVTTTFRQPEPWAAPSALHKSKIPEPPVPSHKARHELVRASHVSRIAQSSASSARALARAKREVASQPKLAPKPTREGGREELNSRPAGSCEAQASQGCGREQLTPAAQKPAAGCEACRLKDQAARRKDEEVATLLRELSRSDRQWRDMVALLEGQLEEARNR